MSEEPKATDPRGSVAKTNVEKVVDRIVRDVKALEKWGLCAFVDASNGDQYGEAAPLADLEIPENEIETERAAADAETIAKLRARIRSLETEDRKVLEKRLEELNALVASADARAAARYGALAEGEDVAIGALLDGAGIPKIDQRLGDPPAIGAPLSISDRARLLIKRCQSAERENAPLRQKAYERAKEAEAARADLEPLRARVAELDRLLASKGASPNPDYRSGAELAAITTFLDSVGAPKTAFETTASLSVCDRVKLFARGRDAIIDENFALRRTHEESVAANRNLTERIAILENTNLEILEEKAEADGESRVDELETACERVAAKLRLYVDDGIEIPPRRAVKILEILEEVLEE